MGSASPRERSYFSPDPLEAPSWDREGMEWLSAACNLPWAADSVPRSGLLQEELMQPPPSLPTCCAMLLWMLLHLGGGGPAQHHGAPNALRGWKFSP